MRLALARRFESTSHTATSWISARLMNPDTCPPACFPRPITPSEMREFGFVSADQTREGKINGAAPAASTDWRKERREKDNFICAVSTRELALIKPLDRLRTLCSPREFS